MKRLATMLGALLLVTTACRGSGASSEASDGFYGDTAITAEEETPVGPLQFQTLTANYSKHLGRTDVRTEIAIDVPQGNSPGARELTKKILHFLNEITIGYDGTPTVGINSLSKASLDKYSNEYLDIMIQRYHTYPYFQQGPDYTLYVKAKCLVSSDYLVSYTIYYFIENFEDGGIDSSAAYTFDLRTLEEVSLNNMVASDKRKQFNELLLSTMREQSSSFKGDYYRTVVSTGDEIGVWEGIDGGCSKPSFTEDGLSFDYDGPAGWYEDGFVIPYAKLRGLVKPEIEALFPAN